MCLIANPRPGPYPPTILVAEDEPTVREIVVRFLGLGGFTTLEAATAEEALQVALCHPGRIDAVLLDAGLLLLDGKGAADRLVAARPQARVLYCSGYARTDLEASGVLPPNAPFLA